MSALSDLLATRQFVMVDLFKITLAATGQELNFTNADFSIYFNSENYLANSLQISGLKFKRSVGLIVDEQTVVINATRDMTFNGNAWFDEIRNGLLDCATISRTRIFAESWDALQSGTIAGSKLIFDGIVSTIDSMSPTECQIKVKSWLTILNQPMPRNTWQTTCVHTLYDGGCGLSKTSYRASATAGTGSTASQIVWSGATSGYYWQGTITFTSGTNAGLSRTIKSSDGANLYLAFPLPNTPASGDSFYVYPGCDKTYATCGSRFSNTNNFRGFPFIPVPQTAL